MGLKDVTSQVKQAITPKANYAKKVARDVSDAAQSVRNGETPQPRHGIPGSDQVRAASAAANMVPRYTDSMPWYPGSDARMAFSPQAAARGEGTYIPLASEGAFIGNAANNYLDQTFGGGLEYTPEQAMLDRQLYLDRGGPNRISGRNAAPYAADLGAAWAANPQARRRPLP